LPRTTTHGQKRRKSAVAETAEPIAEPEEEAGLASRGLRRSLRQRRRSASTGRSNDRGDGAQFLCRRIGLDAEVLQRRRAKQQQRAGRAEDDQAGDGLVGAMTDDMSPATSPRPARFALALVTMFASQPLNSASPRGT
jgi:hypothetical protein